MTCYYEKKLKNIIIVDIIGVIVPYKIYVIIKYKEVFYMKELLAIFISCFLLLMCIFLVILIIKGIFFIIYQKSDKIHFTLFLSCTILS